MRKSIKVFIATFGLLSMTVTTFATTPNLLINVGKGRGYHLSTGNLVDNIIRTEGIATPLPPHRPAPFIGVHASFTHPVVVYANKSAYKTVEIRASISKPDHNHWLTDTGNDEY